MEGQRIPWVFLWKIRDCTDWHLLLYIHADRLCFGRVLGPGEGTAQLSQISAVRDLLSSYRVRSVRQAGQACRAVRPAPEVRIQALLLRDAAGPVGAVQKADYRGGTAYLCQHGDCLHNGLRGAGNRDCADFQCYIQLHRFQRMYGYRPGNLPGRRRGAG